ncbi:MAG: hypothetical protein HWE25_13145 [Alphaproteobacteria bacterium]|nr:hypothetical protein [Alphaproteobacteria bacterium]
MTMTPKHLIGKSNPMTVITPVARWKRLGTWLVLFIFRHLPLGIVKQLAFIHFARWITIKREDLPRLTEDQPKENWPYDLYLFTTNFNGSWDQYIDAFGRIESVSKGLNMLWYTSSGFPGPWPMRLFKRYIHYFEYPQYLYYNAYPGAAVRDIDMALQLERKLDDFVARTEKPVDDREFEVLFNAFFDDVAPNLGQTGREDVPTNLEHRAQPLELSQ